MASSVDDLKTSRSVLGRPFPNFEASDANIASSLKKIIPNWQIRERVHREEQKAQKDDRFLRGRQIAYMIYEYLVVTGTHEAFLDFSDLLNLSLRGDDVRGFDTRCDEVLLSVRQVPSDEILESFYKV